MHRIIELDKELFLELNKLHSKFLDPVMLLVSSYTFWVIVACLIMIWMMNTKGKILYRPVLAFTFLSVLLTNVLNQVVKVIVERPRPIHEETFQGVIHAIEKYDTSYSFFSAHSSTSFALAVFALLAIRKPVFTVIVLFWAVIVAYSRVYLGKHYPLDILTGILFGTLIAMICYHYYHKYEVKKINKDK